MKETKQIQEVEDKQVTLPYDKPVVLRAGTDEHARGLIVTYKSSGGYDINYWYGSPDKIVPAELKGDGKSLGSVKTAWFGYHPETDEGMIGERLKKGESGCCHKCGHSHPKGGKHPTPYKTGKNSCASRTSEAITLPVEIGDTVLMGKFKNRKVVVKTIDWNEKGDLLINGRTAMKMRILKKKEEPATEEYTVENRQDIKEFISFMKEYKPDMNEADYEGRKVKLGKPMQGDVKKFKVYVKNPKGNTIKVNFGQKGMSIKKNNPGAKKSFRARHNCDEPGPKTKARYWSCRKW